MCKLIHNNGTCYKCVMCKYRMYRDTYTNLITKLSQENIDFCFTIGIYKSKNQFCCNYIFRYLYPRQKTIFNIFVHR